MGKCGRWNTLCRLALNTFASIFLISRLPCLWILHSLYFSIPLHLNCSCRFLKLYLSMFGCIGLLLLQAGFFQLRWVRATLLWRPGRHQSAGFWQLWCTGLVAPGHVGPSWARDPTRVALAGRFLTTGPPGKSRGCTFLGKCIIISL